MTLNVKSDIIIARLSSYRHCRWRSIRWQRPARIRRRCSDRSTQLRWHCRRSALRHRRRSVERAFICCTAITWPSRLHPTEVPFQCVLRVPVAFTRRLPRPPRPYTDRLDMASSIDAHQSRTHRQRWSLGWETFWCLNLLDVIIL